LTDIAPTVGTGNLSPSDKQGTLILHCGSGQSNDQDRSVSYDLLASYRAFQATASVSGRIRPEARLQLDVFVDDMLLADPIVQVGRSAAVSVHVDNARILQLRLICSDADGILTISGALLVT
jgi:hypothetical protein